MRNLSYTIFTVRIHGDDKRQDHVDDNSLSGGGRAGVDGDGGAADDGHAPRRLRQRSGQTLQLEQAAMGTPRSRLHHIRPQHDVTEMADRWVGGRNAGIA